LRGNSAPPHDVVLVGRAAAARPCCSVGSNTPALRTNGLPPSRNSGAGAAAAAPSGCQQPTRVPVRLPCSGAARLAGPLVRRMLQRPHRQTRRL